MKSKNIVTILVCPENPDNIGAAARALKNMGFSKLRLIKPPGNWRVKGKKMAMSGADVLKNAGTFPSLKKASADLQVLFGATRRASEKRGRFLGFDKAISRIRKDSANFKTGLVFGCESKGLANKDIRLCDHLVTIPASRVYPSLNLAQAIMVMLFSISLNENHETSTEEPDTGFLNKREIDITMKRFETALEALGYRKGGAELLPRILQTTRDLIKRNGLLEKEAQMIKGLSRRIVERDCRPLTNRKGLSEAAK